MKKKWIALIFILLIFICIYIFTGLFVIQPIGAVPQGRTIWYLRSGLNISFISSADGILLKNDTGVSLLGRSIILGEVLELIEGRIILKLPYIDLLYGISTNGVRLEK